MRSSIQLGRLLEANGIRYLHFLQPNQYLAGSKPMGERERRIAIREAKGYGPFATQAYPLLREAGKRISGAGIEYHDLTGIFEQTEAQVYIDACCHMNRLGNDVLAERISEAILAASPPGRAGAE